MVPPMRRARAGRFAVASVASLLLVALVTPDLAAQAGKVARIGLLLRDTPKSRERPLKAFRQGLHELGYSEGRSVVVESRFAERDDTLSRAAAELVRLGVDVLVTDSTPAALAAKNATETIPIVMAFGGDPVGAGLIDSLARPGGNLTGLSTMSSELGAKRLELLKEVVPGASRVAVLLNPANPFHAPYWAETRRAAGPLSLELLLSGLESANDFDRACANVTRWGADALYVFEDPILVPPRRTALIDCALKNRLPSVSGVRFWVEGGGLLSLGPSESEMFRRAATFVDKILKGAKPADLPVEQPTRFELVVNLKTARSLGLTIPPSVLGRADEVIR